MRTAGGKQGVLFGIESEARDRGAAGIDGRALAEPLEHRFVVVRSHRQHLSAAVGNLEGGFPQQQAVFGLPQTDAPSVVDMDDHVVAGLDVIAEQGELEPVLTGDRAVATRAVATLDGEDGDDARREAKGESGAALADLDAAGGGEPFGADEDGRFPRSDRGELRHGGEDG